MKATFSLTLDGLVRALRGRAHTLAEEAEARYRRRGREALPAASTRRPALPAGKRRHRDEFAGR